MTAQAGEWVQVGNRLDWIPAAQPASPTGGPGRWHVVTDAPSSPTRWEWFPASPPPASPAGWGPVPQARPQVKQRSPWLLVLAILGGTAGLGAVCAVVVFVAGGSDDDQAQATTPSAAAPSDAQNVCVAVLSDIETGDRRLDDAAGQAAGAERLYSLARSVFGRLDQYPGAPANLDLAVRKLGDAYEAAGDSVTDASTYPIAVVAARQQQAAVKNIC